MDFVIRLFKPHQYDMVKEWGNSQQFDRGTYDFEAFQLLDKNTFWIGELNGEPIASIAIAQYDETFAYVGLYYVKPQHRGKGYGVQIWNHAFQHITASNIGLQCGGGKAEIRYSLHGFKKFHHTTILMAEGTGKPYLSQYLVDCKNLDFNLIIDYDMHYFPAERKVFLQKWINLPESLAMAFVRNAKIQGYGVLRASDKGYRIGPLFADSYQVADQLLKNLIGAVQEGKRIRMEMTDTNQDGKKLARDYSMKNFYTLTRMYTKEQPFKKIQNVYGVTSIELA